MDSLTTELLELLNLKPFDNYLFQGHSLQAFGSRIFGGQLLAQSIIAASHTSSKPVHSLHANFLRPGNAALPVLYEVIRLRNGRSFDSRQVLARQNGKILFSALISMTHFEDGLEYQIPEPEYPLPDFLETEESWKNKLSNQIPEIHRSAFLQAFHIEIRPVDLPAFITDQPSPALHAEYMKTISALTAYSNTDIIHQAIAAYMSDYDLLSAALKPHGLNYFSPHMNSASLDHSMYFHRAFRADEWLKYEMQASVSTQARGLNHGQIWQNGLLVCSTMQESLMRIT